MVKVLPHVMRNINEFNIPSDDEYGYEILYFGVNLILMHEYKLSFNMEVREADHGSSCSSNIEIIIISRKDVPYWKKENEITRDIRLHYYYNGKSINDTFRPTTSDAYAFILSNRTSVSDNTMPKSVAVTLIHTWQQEIRDSQLKDLS
jgi:hypothetical protein